MAGQLRKASTIKGLFMKSGDEKKKSKLLARLADIKPANLDCRSVPFAVLCHPSAGALHDDRGESARAVWRAVWIGLPWWLGPIPVLGCRLASSRPLSCSPV